MSDWPGGPDWWMGADRRWYPPPSHTDPPPGFGTPPPIVTGSRPRPWGFWAALSAVGLVAGLVAAGVALTPHSSSGRLSLTPTSAPDTLASPPGPSQPGRPGPVPGASGPIAPDQGTVAFSDDFTDPNSGWTTHQLASGTTFAYQSGKYVVNARGSLHHFAVAPYEVPIVKLSVRMQATQSPGAPPGAGYGVVCAEGADLQTGLRYEFLLLDTGAWYIARRVGPTAHTVMISHGRAAPAGPRSVAVEGVCNTLGDRRTTRLVMFVAGRKVADVRDRAGTVQDLGWAGGIDVASQSAAASAVSVSAFEERDLSG